MLRCLQVPEMGLEAAIHREVVRRLVAKVALPDHVALIARCFELGRQKRHLQGPAMDDAFWISETDSATNRESVTILQVIRADLRLLRADVDWRHVRR